MSKKEKSNLKLIKTLELMSNSKDRQRTQEHGEHHHRAAINKILIRETYSSKGQASSTVMTKMQGEKENTEEEHTD